MSKVEAKRLVLEELRSVQKSQLDASGVLDNKLRDLLFVISAFLVLIIVFQTFADGWSLGLGIVSGLCVVLVGVILLGLRPAGFHFPIPPDWDEIVERFFDLDEDAALELLIVNYLEAGEENNIFLDRKVKMVNFASFSLPLVVLMFIVWAGK